MTLLPEDPRYLAEREIAHTVCDERGMTCLVLVARALPAGLSHSRADILIRLAPGYPDIAPDMWWVDPPLRTAGGAGSPIPSRWRSTSGASGSGGHGTSALGNGSRG